MEEFGNAREKWLRKYLELPNGIPSHDTFGRVFALLDPDVLEEKLMEWVRSVSRHTETDFGHGRVEVRTCSVCRDLSMIPGAWNRNGLAALVRVVATRHNKKTRAETTETRYYITSLRRCAAAFVAECIRPHWQVENNLHRVLDFRFQADIVRKAFQNAAQSFSRLNRMSLAVVKNTPFPCGRTKRLNGRRLQAAWPVEFLEQLLINL